MVALRSYLTASCHFGSKKLFVNLRTGVPFSKALIFQLIFIVGHMMSESMLLPMPSMLSYPAKKKEEEWVSEVQITLLPPDSCQSSCLVLFVWPWVRTFNFCCLGFGSFGNSSSGSCGSLRLVLEP